MSSQTIFPENGSPPRERCSPMSVLILAVLASLCSSAVLGTAIMSNHWEVIRWDLEQLRQLLWTASIECRPVIATPSRHVLAFDLSGLRSSEGNRTVLLVPMIGGLWQLCIDLTDQELVQLRPYLQSRIVKCIDYLTYEGRGGEEGRRFSDYRNETQLRMQNMAMSCALVCLLLMGVALLLGILGLGKGQNSVILITGVMHLLAAMFALFTSMIMVLRRKSGQSNYDGVISRDFRQIPMDGLQARVVQISWSHDLAWCGVILCSVASFLWIFLSKLLRNSTN